MCLVAPESAQQVASSEDLRAILMVFNSRRAMSEKVDDTAAQRALARE